MPLYPKSQFQQWAEEEPSVLESPMERGLRAAVNMLGLTEPEILVTPTPLTFRDPLKGLLMSKWSKIAKGPGGHFGTKWGSGKVIKDQVGHVASALPKYPAMASPGRGNRINSKALSKRFRNAEYLVDLLANQTIK